MGEEAPSNRVEEEASLWAARLDRGNLTDGDYARLAGWLEAAPEHKQILEEFCELKDRVRHHFSQSETPATKAPLLNWRAPIAAFVAVAAAVVLFVLFTHRARELATTTAERHAITLSEGSRVELNARTSLFVDIRSHERRVKLARGEAWFSVAKDPARPFVIATPSGAVRVTGTEFNVNITPGGKVVITVLEGVVRLNAATGSAKDEPVTRGQRGTMSNGHIEVETLPNGAEHDAIAWRQGQVVFDNVPLSEAMDRFSNYHTRTIHVDLPAANLRLGGRYNLDDLDGFLDALGSVLPVRVIKNADGTVKIAVESSPRK